MRRRSIKGRLQGLAAELQQSDRFMARGQRSSFVRPSTISMSSDDSYYDLAQICCNGHVINSMAREYPTSNAPHCQQCGEATVTTCPNCRTEIRGFYHVPGVISLGHYSAPAFCHQCGEPFPWTQAGLAAARELVETFDAISKEDKESLQNAFPDLVRDTPRTRVAEAKYRQVMKKVGKEAVDGLRSILVDVASEAVKKSLFGA